jgi:hypothetical protein
MAAVSPVAPYVDEELDAWKAERRRTRGIVIVPWRSVYLMASLCFGIASFVLPDTVNDWVDWLLYGLAAASLVAWFRGRGKSVST